MAAASKIDICNMALSHLGSSQFIEDFYPNDTSLEAVQATLWFDQARREVLEAFDWNFARKRGALSLHDEDAPDGQWSYRYTYPSDCLQARKIVNAVGRTADVVAFEIEEFGDEVTILTDAEDAILIYTSDQDNNAVWSNRFTQALALLIAHYMAFALTGNLGTKEGMGQLYARAIRSATGSNASEGMADAPVEADWIAGRT
jgi:hypothetical protein